MIWESGSEESASVSIRRVGNTRDWRTKWSSTQFGLRAHPPAGLVMYHTSRKAVHKKYQLAFGGVDNDAKLFNFDEDWLEVQYRYICILGNEGHDIRFHDERALRLDLHKVKNLVQYEEPGQLPVWFHIRRFRHFEDLANLEIMVLQGENDQFSQPTIQSMIDGYWPTRMNPQRLAAGKQANPPPRVRVWRITDASRFDIRQ